MKACVDFKILLHVRALIGATLLLAAALFGGPARAEETLEPPAIWLSAEPVLRSVAQMHAADEELKAAGWEPSTYDLAPRPTISAQAYAAAKASVGTLGIFSSDEAGRDAQAQPLAPPNKGVDWEGLNQAQTGNLRPPDTHGAVGRGYFMQIVNSHLAVYRNVDQQLLFNTSLASLFNYFTTTVFDPRAMFDKVWLRWIVTATALPESNTVQRQFVAVSRSENPTGAYYIYAIDINPGSSADYFWDFPQVGNDQDSVFITANVFDPDFVGATLFAVAKARLYNGLDFSVPLWQGLNGTLAPPVVLDQNPNAYLLAAPAYIEPGSRVITKYTLSNSSRPDGQTLAVSTIIVPLQYFIPPDGRQPGTTETLDSLDGRFGNWSTQNGDSIWNAHAMTFGSGARAWSYWYEFDTLADTVLNSGNMVAANNSDDFMPHVTVNTDGDIFAVWTASAGDPNGFAAQMRISGKQVEDVNNDLGSGTLVIQSPSVYLQGRWGDYQCVDVASGPGWGNPRVAFAIGEYASGTNFWNARITRMVSPLF